MGAADCWSAAQHISVQALAVKLVTRRLPLLLRCCTQCVVPFLYVHYATMDWTGLDVVVSAQNVDDVHGTYYGLVRAWATPSGGSYGP